MPRKPGDKLREAILGRPAYQLPPDIFSALFLEENEARAIRELRRLRRAMRTTPLLVKLYCLTPLRPRGRPKGSRSAIPEDELFRIGFAVNWYGVSKADVLRFLNRATVSEEYRWLKRRLNESQAIFTEICREDPSLIGFVERLGNLSARERKGAARILLRPLRKSD
jgi:hypothetical protein